MSTYLNSHLTNLFDIIQIPISNLLINKNNISNIEIINCIDLNVANFKKYFPIISTILKNNTYYNKDLLYDFMEVRLMSTYIFDNLEALTDDVFIEINPFSDIIYNNMIFVNKLLGDFHQILNVKNEYIHKDISEETFKTKYENYKLELNQDNEYFYNNFYVDKNEDINKNIIKKIMPIGFDKLMIY